MLPQNTQTTRTNTQSKTKLPVGGAGGKTGIHHKREVSWTRAVLHTITKHPDLNMDNKRNMCECVSECGA